MKLVAGAATNVKGPNEGHALIVNGREVNGPPPNLALVFQEFNKSLFAWRSVLGNVLFGLEARGKPSRADKAKAEALIELVGLKGFDFPAEHWLHWRTTNPVESPCSTVRLRQRVTKGAGSQAQGLVMAYTLLVMAEERWRTRNTPHLLPLVRAKVTCVDGIQQRRHEAERGKEAA